ncbi:MAG: secretory pathway Sec39 family protein [Planctomycetes bacterium]|nr:secretory pathway Sec39 family protein [Planctomycetota bacterium]
MMREAWRKLGHPAPHYKNDRPSKAFEFFIPELDKEVDMASDLVKAMFGGYSQANVSVEAHDEAHERLSEIERKILSACIDKPQNTPDLLTLLGYGNRTGNLKKALAKLRDTGLLELTIPEKPRSKNQRYRMTAKGRRMLLRETHD